MKKIKDLIFRLAPRNIQRKFILKRTGANFLEANVANDNKFKMYIVPNRPLWENRLKAKYGHEPAITVFYEKHLQVNDVVFDVGAHMGYFPSLISAVKPEVRIYAFEANWFTYAYLIRNKVINDKYNTWKTYNCFISDEDALKGGERFITLDGFTEDHNVIPTILQMDVDGEEYRVMKGSRKLLNNGITEFLIEVHPKDLSERNIQIDQFLNLFSKEHYTLSYLPNLRDNNIQWAHTIDNADLEEEFYLYAVPVGKKNRLVNS